ncbi:MAG TPA: hypothetical protein VF513_01270, partial [Stenotrophomonas sp.]
VWSAGTVYDSSKNISLTPWWFMGYPGGVVEGSISALDCRRSVLFDAPVTSRHPQPTAASAGVGLHAGSVGLVRSGSQNARGRSAARVAPIS